jgi:hypothetical protein
MTPTRGRLTVFEVSNKKVCEIYLTATPFPIVSTMTFFWLHLPRALRHWKEGHSVTFRALETHMTAEAAGAFIRGFLARPPQTGWRYVLGSMGASKHTKSPFPQPLRMDFWK